MEEIGECIQNKTYSRTEMIGVSFFSRLLRERECVCLCERERERARKKERKKERERPSLGSGN